MSLVITPLTILEPCAKESSLIAASPALSKAPSPVKIVPCTTAPYPISSSELMDLFGSLLLKILAHGVHSWDSGRASHKYQVMHVLLIDTLPRRHLSTWPLELQKFCTRFLPFVSLRGESSDLSCLWFHSVTILFTIVTKDWGIGALTSETSPLPRAPAPS